MTVRPATTGRVTHPDPGLVPVPPPRAGRARSAAWCAVTGVLQAVATLGTTVVIAHAMTPDQVGVYGLATWWLTMAIIVATTGHGTTTMKFAAEALGRGDPG